MSKTFPEHLAPESILHTIVDAAGLPVFWLDKGGHLHANQRMAADDAARNFISAVHQRLDKAKVGREFFGPYDYAGTHEVAEFLSVRKQVVSNYAARRLDFPQPVVRLAMGPIYRLCDIRDWKRAEDIRRGK